MWFADYQQGEGTMYYYNGDVYIGNWFQDKRSGKGTYTWKAGAKYEGEWKEDKKTDRALWYGPTSQNMKVSGKMTHVTERGHFTCQR